MMIDRRGFLACTGGLLLPCTPGQTAESALSAGGDDKLRLVAAQGRLRLRPDGPETPVLRYGADAPLQMIRIRRGETLRGRIRNDLAEPTSLQWHGLRGLGSLDDPALQRLATIPPGSEQAFAVTPLDSGTAWFHAAPGAADQTALGLGGVLVVDEDAPPAVDHDIVCFLHDWTLDAIAPGGSAATVITVGNRPLPSNLTVQPGSRLRLRLVNGSTRRAMVVACEGAKPKIVAIDGQPSDLFEPIRGAVPIGPGARFDWMLDLPADPGKTVQLILRGTEAIGGAVEPDRIVATIGTEGAVLGARPPLTALPPNPALPAQIPLEAAKRVDLTIDGGTADRPVWTVNGASGGTLADTPVIRVRQGDAVTLGFVNATKALVALRVFGQALRLLHAKDDGWEPYWRDTVLLPPTSRNHVAFVAATPGRWPIESCFNDQAVAGLRCWFAVSPR